MNTGSMFTCMHVPTDAHPMGGPTEPHRNTTTSSLTTATLIYAIGAGITAAAGTRLALQLILVKVFYVVLIPIARPERPRIDIYCHYLPELGLGNLRACCLPWMW